MQNWKAVLLACSVCLLLHSCHKITVDTPAEIIINDNETVVAGINGIVVNESNMPVAGAVVKCGNSSTTTDSYGAFVFKDISISKNNGYVKVSKTGYFNGNRTFIATAGRTHNMRIKLLSKNITGTFAAAAGGTVTLATGSKVTFAANSITDAAGIAYTGTVNVAMAWINPAAADISSTIQGDLRGVTAGGYERVLETYGMLGVDLTGASGQELKIASGKKADISVTIPTDLQASAPASIPLWHFDETKGRWVEEGSATKVGSNYVGSVSHFSFWNCDIGANGVNLCINIVGTNNQPLNNVTVRLRRANNPAGMSYGQTDAIGNVCGMVFANEPLVLDVLNNCGNSVYTQNIGPFTTNASINIIASIAATNTVTFTGTLVNCSNAPVTNGSITIYQTGGFTYNTPVTNGTFNFTLLTCSATNNTYTLIGVDNIAHEAGNPVTVINNGGTVNVGPVGACGNVLLPEFYNITVDGVPYSWTTPSTYDSSGSFDQGAFYGYTSSPTLIFLKNSPALQGIVTLQFFNNDTIGSYRIVNSQVTLSFSYNNSLSSTTIASVNPVVHITAMGPHITGYLEGNYNINMLFQTDNTIRNVVGNFKMRRP